MFFVSAAMERLLDWAGLVSVFSFMPSICHRSYGQVLTWVKNGPAFANHRQFLATAGGKVLRDSHNLRGRRGERSDCEAVTQSQIAATLAAFLGKDYAAQVPQAGKPMRCVLPSNGK